MIKIHSYKNFNIFFIFIKLKYNIFFIPIIHIFNINVIFFYINYIYNGCKKVIQFRYPNLVLILKLTCLNFMRMKNILNLFILDHFYIFEYEKYSLA